MLLISSILLRWMIAENMASSAEVTATSGLCDEQRFHLMVCFVQTGRHVTFQLLGFLFCLSYFFGIIKKYFNIANEN